MKVTAFVADDEPVARAGLRGMLRAFEWVEVVGEAGDGESAAQGIRALKPELVFLDVQMPECDGFEVVSRLPAAALPSVIFVTAFDRYAMRAFDVHAIDFLLKPFSGARFRLALSRARERIRIRKADTGLASLVASLRQRPRYLSRLSVRTGDKIVLVDVRTVDWIEAADNYVRVHAGPREFVLRETLTALEKLLDPETFARIHRSVIVRIDRILELHPASHGDMDVVLRDGKHLTLSRTWRERVTSLFGSH